MIVNFRSAILDAILKAITSICGQDFHGKHFCVADWTDWLSLKNPGHQAADFDREASRSDRLIALTTPLRPSVHDAAPR